MRNKSIDEMKVRSSVERIVTKYAESSPFSLNPDKAVVRNIITGLMKNKIRYGYAYCPCKEVTGIPEKDRDNICPCRTHKEEIARQGTCECGLFVSKAYFNAKKK
jgi:ferredoxin-thioredoxin reductase catalytic chain